MEGADVNSSSYMDNIRQAALVLKCRCCRKDGDAVSLKLCAACGAARYCSKECQVADFKGHKKMCTMSGMITLMDAINRNDADTVRKMARTKRILNGRGTRAPFGFMGLFQETALHHCVAKKNSAMMAILLEQDEVIVDIIDSDYETPLCFASTVWGTTEIVRLLLEAGADPNTQRGLGWNPLKLSMMTGDYAMTKHLLDYGAFVSFECEHMQYLLRAQKFGCNMELRPGESQEEADIRYAKIHDLVRSYCE